MGKCSKRDQHDQQNGDSCFVNKPTTPNEYTIISQDEAQRQALHFTLFGVKESELGTADGSAASAS